MSEDNLIDKPSVLIVSSSNTKPSSIIKLLTKQSKLQCEANGELVHSWAIDTKYYTANVNLIGIGKTYQRTQKFNDNVEALIIHIDTNKESGLEDLHVWEPLEQDCRPDVKLLVSNYCTKDTKVTIEKALEWCLKHGYEFIELYPTVSKKDQNNEIFKEKFGVERIVEALETHAWPNLVMKNSSKCRQMKTDDANSSHEPDHVSSDECHKWNSVNQDTDSLTTEGFDDFSEIFSQLDMMRESLQGMPASQKRLCAEQMATAFWKAIGGDEEEIADL